MADLLAQLLVVEARRLCWDTSVTVEVFCAASETIHDLWPAHWGDWNDWSLLLERLGWFEGGVASA